ncbi:MAG: hypothetical protein EoVTN8_602 [Fluviibacter phosphoraccumulans EoVTN8]
MTHTSGLNQSSISVDRSIVHWPFVFIQKLHFANLNENNRNVKKILSGLSVKIKKSLLRDKPQLIND